jgi:methylmalonyl-CoA/ethylmalonyl-CoA epimerase
MKLRRIEHVGIVVRDVEASRRLWEECLGIPMASVEDHPDFPVRLAMFPVGESVVELLSGTTDDSKYARMSAEGCGGLNHICFEVEDIDGALAELKLKGVALLDQQPRVGQGGSRIAFLDPAGTEGCLIELAEWPELAKASRI